MKKSILLLLIVMTANFIFAQNIFIPKNYKLETSEDFQKYEKDALECINWLNEKKFDQYVDERKEAYLFVYKWIVTNPNYDYGNITTIMADIIDDNNPFRAELIMAYLMGEIKFAANNKNTTHLKIHLAGIENLLAVAENNSHLNFNSKAVNKYSKHKKQDKLESWIKIEMENKTANAKKNNKQIFQFSYWFMK